MTYLFETSASGPVCGAQAPQLCSLSSSLGPSGGGSGACARQNQRDQSFVVPRPRSVAPVRRHNPQHPLTQPDNLPHFFSPTPCALPPPSRSGPARVDRCVSGRLHAALFCLSAPYQRPPCPPPSSSVSPGSSQQQELLSREPILRFVANLTPALPLAYFRRAVQVSPFHAR